MVNCHATNLPTATQQTYQLTRDVLVPFRDISVVENHPESWVWVDGESSNTLLSLASGVDTFFRPLQSFLCHSLCCCSTELMHELSLLANIMLDMVSSRKGIMASLTLTIVERVNVLPRIRSSSVLLTRFPKPYNLACEPLTSIAGRYSINSCHLRNKSRWDRNRAHSWPPTINARPGLPSRTLGTQARSARYCVYRLQLKSNAPRRN